MNWKSIKLGDAATFINGYAFKPSDWNDTGKEIIRIQNLTGSSTETNYYSGQIPNRYLVKRGNLLISWSATLGIYEWAKEDAWLNQHIFKVVFDKEEFDKGFFRHLIGQMLEQMGRAVHGSTMKHITKKRFDNLQIPLPPLPEQKKIAAILDAADELRQKDKALIEKYDKLAQSLFLDMFGDPAKNNKNWGLIPFKELGHWKSGGTPSRTKPQYYLGDINWFSAGELNTKILKESKEKITMSAIEENLTKLFPAESMLIGMYDTAAFKVGILNEASSCNQACLNITPNESINIQWFYHYITLTKQYYSSKSRGVRQKNLNKSMIQNFLLPLPPKVLQDKFTKIVHDIDSQKEFAQQSLVKSEELFNSLLQKAFKGELTS